MPTQSHPVQFPKLAARLAELDLQRKQLAELVPCNPAYLSHIIRGHSTPSPKLRARIAEILESPEAELFATREELAA